MLNLEPPKIDLDSFMKMGADGQKLKKKKLSTKQRRFKKLLQERNQNMQLDQNPKTLLDKQMESISQGLKTDELKKLSRGQKKRLMNKVKQFSSKQALGDKFKKHNEQLKAERAAN